MSRPNIPDEDRGVGNIVEDKGTNDSEDALDLGFIRCIDGDISHRVAVEAYRVNEMHDYQRLRGG